MDTCKKVIISGNYKDMEEKINFLTSDDGSWCIDYEDDIKVTEEASLNLINKDFENEVEISFNAETPYELDCINHIFTLLSMNIMNMSDVW